MEDFVKKFEHAKNVAEIANEELDNLERTIHELRSSFKAKLSSTIQESQYARFEEKYLDDFLKEPYLIIPKKEQEWYVIAPRFIDFQIGWLERSTKSYNVFVVNKYMNWLAEVPEQLKSQFKFKPTMPLKVFDGVVLTGEQHQEETWKRYSKHLSMREGKDRIKIAKGHEFHLIADMIEDGIMPFMPKPIAPEDWREPTTKIQLRNYQIRAFNQFKELGAVGIYWAMGAGKTFFGLSACSAIKGMKVIVVPTTTLKEQWEERIYKYIPEYKNEIIVVTYNGYEKLRNRKFALIIFDECHRLPANTFSRLATIDATYRIGLSATPYREDGRTDYIFALTGFPIGMDWNELIEQGFLVPPDITVYVVDDKREKTERLADLLKVQQKTIVFCDSIDYGMQLSKRFEIPFIYGQTKNRMDVLKESVMSIVSRVGDEGVSLPDIERVIEVDFQFGSRRQEGQRVGRLFHSEMENTQHIILMTEEEITNYEKRLYALYEKGFKVRIVR